MIVRRFARGIGSLADLHTFVHTFCSDRGIERERAFDLDLVLEELFTNQVKYHPGGREIEVALEGDDRQVTMTVTDRDVEPFDPTSIPAAASQRADPLEGGRGLLLVRALTDELRYDYRERTSRITAVKRWSH